MAFLGELKKFKKDDLSHVETIVTKHNGEKVKEVDGSIIFDPSLNKDRSSDNFFVIDAAPDQGLHEVTKGLFIGSQDAAANFEGLKSNSITHILNSAIYVDNFFPGDFVYRSESIYDEPSFDISPYLDTCADFIKDTLDSGGRVLVHCNAGISRSSTLIIAFLMKCRKMSLDDSLELVRVVRPFARPNAGFMSKLKEYEEILRIVIK